MPVRTRIGIFAALWALVGFIHLLPLTSGGLIETAIPWFLGLTLLIFPIRSFLLNSILDIQLEGWLKTTVKAALGGIGGAFCAVLAVFVLSAFMKLTSINVYIVAYIAFRLTVIWWQYHHIEKLYRTWLYLNIGALSLLSLVLINLFQSSSVYYGDFIMRFLGIILSELLVSFSYINLKLGEDPLQKRKVEEMQR